MARLTDCQSVRRLPTCPTLYDSFQPTVVGFASEERMSQPRSPTVRLLAGLAVTLSAVALYSGYTIMQLHGLEQSAGRHHRPQPRRFAAAAAHSEQSEFARPGHARHAGRQRAVSADRLAGQFRRIRTDLEDAMAREARSSPLDRDAEQRST